MIIQQLSIFLENKPGRVAEVSHLLGDAGINIRALSLAETKDFGILRLIVNKPEVAVEMLKKRSFIVRETEVIAIEIPDIPGSMTQVFDILSAKGLNVDYLYAFVEKSSPGAVVIFRIDDPKQAIAVLAEAGIGILSAEKVYDL